MGSEREKEEEDPALLLYVELASRPTRYTVQKEKEEEEFLQEKRSHLRTTIYVVHT